MMMMLMHTEGQEYHLAQHTGATIFLQAMKEGKVQLAHFVLVALGEAAANASLDSKVAAGRTLLMCASVLPCVNERACFMQLLLGRGADVQRQDGAGRTALSLASEHGFLDAVRLLVLHGARVDTLDNERRSPLEYALEGHHDDVARFLLKESKGQGGTGKVDMQARVVGGQQVIETFVSSLSHPQCQRTVSDPLIVEQVICNPYALGKEEEKFLSQHDYKKPSNPSDTVPPLHPLAPLFDEIVENPVLCNPEEEASSCTTEQFSKLHQMSSKVNSKSGFLPAWMKKSSACPLKSLSAESGISKPSGSFSKRMASKMALSSTSSLRESQINLLTSEGEVMDSSSSKISQDILVRKLQNILTDTVLQNHCSLEKSTQWMESTEGFPKKDFEKCSCTEKLLHSPIKWSKLPRDKYLSSIRNAVNVFSQSEQNSALTRSGCNVFKALRSRAYPELRFLHMGQLDPEQKMLVREEHTNSSELLE